MNYFKEIDTWLDELLTNLPARDRELCKAEIKEELLRSYRNGQAADTKAKEQPAEDNVRAKESLAQAAKPERPRTAPGRSYRRRS